jgi:DUF1680 family protein
MEGNGPVNSSVEDDFLTLRGTWSPGDVVELDIDMPVQRVAADARVDANAGRLAIQRGPLVYAAEAVDNGGAVRDLVLPTSAALAPRFEPDLLGGLMVLEGTARRDGVEVPFRAIPYFAWANRGESEMAVWFPTGEDD